MNLSPFTKDFRGGDLCEWSVFLGDSAQSRATLEFQKQSEFDCLPARSGRKCSWSLSLLSAFAVPVSRLHIYLTSVERQSFFICDGIPNPGHDLFRVGPKQRSLQLLKAYQRLMRFEFEHFHWLCKPASTKHWWYCGEHSCLPSSWPGFDFQPHSIRLGPKSILNLLWHLAAPETFGWVFR